MDNKDIDEIIASKLRGNISEEESILLKQWIKKSDKNSQLFEYLQQLWKEKSAKPRVPNAGEALNRIWQEATGEYSLTIKEEKSTISWKKYISIAAAIALLAVMTLVLSDLNKQQVEVVKVQMIEKTTKAGYKLRVTLPDSSIVWINTQSSIRYPERFTDTHRRVELSGEAYFDVKKDPRRTFEVITNELIVRALGTSFNVNAFDKKEIKVALTEGKVEIEDKESLTILLSPGELATYNTRLKSFEKIKSPLEKEVCWKDGKMMFENADFNAVIQKLESWYGVEFVYDDLNIPEWDFTANFTDSSLENALKVIGFSEGFQFNMEGKIVTLYY